MPVQVKINSIKEAMYHVLTQVLYLQVLMKIEILLAIHYALRSCNTRKY